jgi:streptogramin lyase
VNPRGARLAVLAVTLLVATGSARGQCFTEFRASSGSGPADITAGPDGNLWFTENGSPNAMGRISPDSSNTITEFSIPSADITKGPDGNLRFTQIQQSVWRMTIADCEGASLVS